MAEYKALVFNIQGYSIQDGPGIRTTVFLKGCPLRCLWCSNPESQTFAPDVLLTPAKCVSCGTCLKMCRHGAVHIPELSEGGRPIPVLDHSICAECGDQRCVFGCFGQALETVGDFMTAEELVDRIEKDAPFFRNSGGGVTLSGGEPLMHPAFCLAFLQRCREIYIHTAIETTGYADWEAIEPLLEYTDLFLYDLKQIDSKKHKELTGVGNEKILDNLKRLLAQEKAAVIVRMPIIPGLNDDEEDLRRAASFIKENGGHIVHILAYHRMGMGKYEGLGREYRMDADLESPSDAHMEEIRTLFASYGLTCGIGGNGLYEEHAQK